MPRVVCPVCRTGFEANISRDNFALNCVACGIAFNASSFLSKDDYGPGADKSAKGAAKYPQPAHDSTRTGGLPFMNDPATPEKPSATNGANGNGSNGSNGSNGAPKPPELAPLPKRKLPVTHPLASQRPSSNAQLNAVKVVDAPPVIGLPTPPPGAPISAERPVLRIVGRPQAAEDETPASAPSPAPVAAIPIATAEPAPKPPVKIPEAKPKKNRRPLLEGSFGPYDIEGEIARGGVGAVFKARERDTGRQVALKVLLDGEEAGEAERERFRHECETAKALSLPGMVQVYTVGELDQRPYMAMELINGRSLDKIIPEKTLSVNDCLVLMRSVAETIGALHEAGYVHRDLKPGNILIDEFGSPKVADFGLVKSLDEITRLTASGLVCGTPAYMAPEQARGDGKAVDPRSDVWALGAVLYEMLASRPPFQAENALRLMLRITKNQPTPLRTLNLKVPHDVNEIVMRCLEKTAERRYANARAMAMDIARFLNGEPLENASQPKVQQLVNAAVRNSRALGVLAGMACAIALCVFGVRYLLTPKDPQTLVNNGYAILLDRSVPAAERITSAEKLFLKASELDPKNARAQLLLGSCWGQEALSAKNGDLKKLEQARAVIRHAAELDAQLLPDCHAQMAVFDRLMKRYDTEAREWEEALKFAPNNLKYRDALAMAYWWSGDYVRALKEYQTVLDANPEYPHISEHIKALKELTLNQSVARR